MFFLLIHAIWPEVPIVFFSLVRLPIHTIWSEVPIVLLYQMISYFGLFWPEVPMISCTRSYYIRRSPVPGVTIPDDLLYQE